MPDTNINIQVQLAQLLGKSQEIVNANREDKQEKTKDKESTKKIENIVVSAISANSAGETKTTETRAESSTKAAFAYVKPKIAPRRPAAFVKSGQGGDIYWMATNINVVPYFEASAGFTFPYGPENGSDNYPIPNGIQVAVASSDGAVMAKTEMYYFDVLPAGDAHFVYNYYLIRINNAASILVFEVLYRHPGGDGNAGNFWKEPDVLARGGYAAASYEQQLNTLDYEWIVELGICKKGFFITGDNCILIDVSSALAARIRQPDFQLVKQVVPFNVIWRGDLGWDNSLVQSAYGNSSFFVGLEDYGNSVPYSVFASFGDSIFNRIDDMSIQSYDDLPGIITQGGTLEIVNAIKDADGELLQNDQLSAFSLIPVWPTYEIPGPEAIPTGLKGFSNRVFELFSTPTRLPWKMILNQVPVETTLASITRAASMTEGSSVILDNINGGTTRYTNIQQIQTLFFPIFSKSDKVDYKAQFQLKYQMILP